MFRDADLTIWVCETSGEILFASTHFVATQKWISCQIGYSFDLSGKAGLLEEE